MTLPLPAFDRYRVELRLAKPATFPFEHGGVLRGLFSRALGRHELPHGLIPFPCESGRVVYAPGDPYALGITLVESARALADEIPAALERHGGARPTTPAPVLGGNYVVERVERLPAPDLDADAAALRGAPRLELRFLSPFRLARPADLKHPGAGFLDHECFPMGFFLDRLWRRIFYLARGAYPENEERQALQPPVPEGVAAAAGHLLWNDLPVRGTQKKGRPYTLGGVRGAVTFDGLDDPWLETLAAGAYLHAGSSTAYGCGRYAVAGTSSAGDPYVRRARSLLASVADPAMLERALDHVLEGREDDEPPEDEDAPDVLLASLGRDLAGGDYVPRPLTGFVLRKDDGGVRPLAVPVLRDKVAQRAAVEVLAPALDTLLEEASYAYRRGFSRQGAARAIERAYADGYRYVLDADIRAFFDRVDWSILFAKLEAFYPGEPLVELLRAWVESPVFFSGHRIERDRGLPQGSPVSPLLANLYLDTFDEELLDQGFRLVRFADDFVVLTKDPDAARHAKTEVEEALARLRLELNPDETAIRSIDDGFSYLGYLFVRSLVLDQVKDDDVTAAPRPLTTNDVPGGSWLASVPLARIEALLAGRGKKEDRTAGYERVPLVHAAALDHGRWPLYVTTHDTRVYLRQKNVVMEPEGGEERQQPLAAISHAVFIGRVRVTVPVLQGLARHGIPSFFCRASGELEAVFGPHEPNWHLWLEQARAAADERLCLGFAAAVVRARLRNMAAIAVRLGWQGAAEMAVDLRALARETENKTTCDSLRGLEGQGSARMWHAFAASLPEEWGFSGRARRPPPDPVNAMLSFGHTLLYNHCATALVEAGLDPRIGLYHQPHGAHSALASDLQEEVRHLVESLVWTLVGRQQVTPDDFGPSPDGSYPALLTPEGRRTFLHAFERRLVTEFTPEGEDKPLSYRAFLLRQARQIRDLVRGARPVYEPLLLKG